MRRRAGIKLGDEIEFKASRGVLIIVPKARVATRFLESLRAVQEEAKKHGLDKLTMKEINAEIAAYRAEKRQKASSRPK